MQLINPSTSPNELNTTLTPHSIIHGDACFAYFNKIWGIPNHWLQIIIRNGRYWLEMGAVGWYKKIGNMEIYFSDFAPT